MAGFEHDLEEVTSWLRRKSLDKRGLLVRRADLRRPTEDDAHGIYLIQILLSLSSDAALLRASFTSEGGHSRGWAGVARKCPRPPATFPLERFFRYPPNVRRRRFVAS